MIKHNMKDYNRRLYENIMKDVAKVVKRKINEDIVPEDEKGDVKLSTKESINLWKMLYRLMDNVKQVMENTEKNKNGVSRIGQKDVDEIVEYIYDSIKNVMNTYNNKSRK